MLLAIMPVTAVKIFDIHSDAKFHELYPDDEDKAHREAAAAMEDCPFCNIQLSNFIVVDATPLPQVQCITLHEHSYRDVREVTVSIHRASLRAPPAFS